MLAETDRKIYFLMQIAHSDYLDVEQTWWQSDMSYALILLQRRIVWDKIMYFDFEYSEGLGSGKYSSFHYIFILFLFYVYILFSSYRVWIILFVLFVEFFLVSFSCIWDIPSHGFSLWLLLVSVMIHSDAKRRLSVPSSLNGSGRLPGNQKVHRSSPREQWRI